MYPPKDYEDWTNEEVDHTPIFTKHPDKFINKLTRLFPVLFMTFLVLFVIVAIVHIALHPGESGTVFNYVTRFLEILVSFMLGVLIRWKFGKGITP